MNLDFKELPAVTARRDIKRGISFNKDGLTIESDISLDPSLTIFNHDDKVTVTANHAEISSSVTYSGKLKYSIWQFKLTEFTFDITKSMHHELDLTFEFTADYNYTFEYDVTPLSYYVVNVPGIITLGPELSFGIGVDFDVVGDLTISTNLTSTVENGAVHIDFLDASENSVTNWEPTYTATANISELANVTITPFVKVTLELECEILGGLLDLSTGVTVQPQFPVAFAVDANQDGVGSGNVTLPSGEDCTNGFAATVDFEVEVILFATKWASVTYDVYNQSIGAYCYQADWLAAA